MTDILKLIGRSEKLFTKDLALREKELSALVANSQFLVIGGAGSIGSAVVKEIFKRNPRVLHVVDISENNLTELVRDIRSTLHGAYIKGDFATFAIDAGSSIFDSFIINTVAANSAYDYILNLSALKHVRSEKDPYTLMRMIDVNIFNTYKTMLQAKVTGAKKYFCVSTDKAANPVNMMGASKRIMELFLLQHAKTLNVSTARFANVAFSDGSLLYGFQKRLEKEQPISAPNDVRRYFVTQEEAGLLCLFSCLLGNNKEIFFPKISEELNLITFSEIADKYLASLGLAAFPCSSEEEARERVQELKAKKLYPVYYFKSDTTGEKDFEEFWTVKETPDFSRFNSIGVLQNELPYTEDDLTEFVSDIDKLKEKGVWTRKDLIVLFQKLLPEFEHKETGKFLDGKM
jgi:FlaA1/EpsC-like NDP-sugar epimerase